MFISIKTYWTKAYGVAGVSCRSRWPAGKGFVPHYPGDFLKFMHLWFQLQFIFINILCIKYF